MLETIKIVDKNNKRGWVIINKSDIKGGDVVYKEKKTAEKKAETQSMSEACQQTPTT